VLRPDHGTALAGLLAGVASRVRLAATLRAAAAAISASAVVAAVLIRVGISPAMAVTVTSVAAAAGTALWLRRRRWSWSTRVAAMAIEQRRPDSRNLVITAEELSRYADRARPRMQMRVARDAAALTRDMRAADIVPLRSPAMAMIGALTLALALVVLAIGLPQCATNALSEAIQGRSAVDSTTDLTIRATVSPPAYTGAPPQNFVNPERIDAVEGSQLRFEVHSTGAWRVRFGSQPLALSAAHGGAVAMHALLTSGYLAIEPLDPNASAHRRLIPVAVTPDHLPTLRVATPGKDVLLPDVRSAVGIAVRATDDFGLRSIELRYTTASGTGEQFEFKEGTIPLEVDRESPRSWKARADVALAKLGLEPGDALVYRVTARDARPGDLGLAISDTFFIEIAGPGQVALAGFDLPPDRERYALSQQMIVLKIDRLRAKERTIARTTLEEEAQAIAAEQRTVRANFVFLMGGHVEDEEIEAEQSHEIQEGRLENTARKDIVQAIQHMSRSELGLAAFNTGAALPAARAAVEALQRAFGKNRYILRTLPVRSRIDPSRRLTGDISAASGWPREQRPAESDSRALAARRLLAGLLELAPAIISGAAPPSALTAFAEDALAVDPTAEEWQRISKRLIQVRDAIGASPSTRSALLNDALAPLASAAQAGSLSPSPDRLRGALFSAWAEARRQQ
jgi:Domain of unknown function (DUF4175)